MKRKTIYVAGPMAGKTDLNHAAFNAAAERLLREGWNVVNPVELNKAIEISGPEMADAVMDAELAIIPHLDAIYLLKGWEDSVGAKKELRVALDNNLIVILERDLPGAA